MCGISSLEKNYPPVYPHTLSYAMEHGAADDYLDSRKLNLDCKNAIEEAIKENFDGMHLAQETAEKGIGGIWCRENFLCACKHDTEAFL